MLIKKKKNYFNLKKLSKLHLQISSIIYFIFAGKIARFLMWAGQYRHFMGFKPYYNERSFC